MITQPLIAFIALLQFASAAHAGWQGDWRVATIQIGVGLANVALMGMKG